MGRPLRSDLHFWELCRVECRNGRPGLRGAFPLSPQPLHAHARILSPPDAHVDLHSRASSASGCLGLSVSSKPPSTQTLHEASVSQIRSQISTFQGVCFYKLILQTKSCCVACTVPGSEMRDEMQTQTLVTLKPGSLLSPGPSAEPKARLRGTHVGCLFLTLPFQHPSRTPGPQALLPAPSLSSQHWALLVLLVPCPIPRDPLPSGHLSPRTDNSPHSGSGRAFLCSPFLLGFLCIQPLVLALKITPVDAL